MSHAAVAERYARAIFDLGVESGQLAQMTAQVQSFADAYAGSLELRGVLENPIIKEADRQAILRNVAARAGLSGNALNAVRLLAARRRLAVLPEIALKLQKLSDEKAGVLRATVTTAHPLPESFYAKLKAQLERATSRKITLEKREDPTLIAGVVTRLGDNVIDGSVKGKLEAYEHGLGSLR